MRSETARQDHHRHSSGYPQHAGQQPSGGVDVQYSNSGGDGSGGGGKTRPVHEVRIGGIKAAVWESRFEGQNGPVVTFRVTISKRYRQDNQWKDTNSLYRDDLLTAAKVLDLCHSWIVLQANSASAEYAER